MAISKIPQPKKYSPLQQAYFLSQTYDLFEVKEKSLKHFKCHLMLKPTSMSAVYTIELLYEFGKTPKVRVIEPEVIEKAPHMYLGGYLCTHYNEWLNWNSTLKISDVILPWVSDWLFYFEIWKATGRWYGEPDPRHTQRLGYVTA